MSRLKSSKSITIFRLAMINVAAIISIKNWPLIAEYGFSSAFLYLLSALIFFIPVGLVTAELASAFPKSGGVFAWVKEAFGQKIGFLAIWLLWIENAIWYPTILSFIASSMTYVFDPALATNKTFIVSFVFLVYWSFTLINMLGMEISSWISTIGAIIGTIIPALIILACGFIWYFTGQPLQIHLNLESFIPNISNINGLVFFTGVILSLAGLEMPSIHAKDVENPQRNYPKAILFSSILIIGLSILGVLAIAMVIPDQEISLVAGSMQAFDKFLSSFGLSSFMPYIALLVVIGALASLSTWIAGPSKGLLAAADSGDLPPLCRKINKKGMPIALLVFQGVIVTLITALFILMPSVNSAFWVMSLLVTQLYVIMYIIMFAAAIYLRYKKPLAFRPYKIPGKNNLGMWITCIVGSVTCIGTLFIGFYPPTDVTINNVPLYVISLLIGIIIACLIPSFITLFHKPSWDELLEHEKKKKD